MPNVGCRLVINDGNIVKKICCIGPLDPGRPVNRNSVLFAGLAECGIELSFISIMDIGTRSAARSNDPADAPHQRFWVRLLPKIVLENVRLFFRILRDIHLVRAADILLIPSYGNYCVLPVKIFALLFKKPIVLDAHGSLYFQRIVGVRDFAEETPYARFIRWVDRTGAILVDRYMTLSHEYNRIISESFRLDPKKFITVYTGTLKKPESFPYDCPPDEALKVDVIYWGSFKLFDGVENLIRAAAVLRDQGRGDIRFILSGAGSSSARLKALRDELNLSNVEMVGWVKEEKLLAYIKRAKLAVGPVGRSLLCSIDFSNKVCEAAAFGKATILVNSPSIREKFVHLESAILFSGAEPEELAKAILLAIGDDGLRSRVGLGARRIYEEYLTPIAVARQFLRETRELVDK